MLLALLVLLLFIAVFGGIVVHPLLFLVLLVALVVFATNRPARPL